MNIEPCPICHLPDGFHEPSCGTLDIGKTDWELISIVEIPEDKWEHRRYEDGGGTIHTVRHLVAD